MAERALPAAGAAARRPGGSWPAQRAWLGGRALAPLQKFLVAGFLQGLCLVCAFCHELVVRPALGPGGDVAWGLLLPQLVLQALCEAILQIAAWELLYADAPQRMRPVLFAACVALSPLADSQNLRNLPQVPRVRRLGDPDGREPAARAPRGAGADDGGTTTTARACSPRPSSRACSRCSLGAALGSARAARPTSAPGGPPPPGTHVPPRPRVAARRGRARQRRRRRARRRGPAARAAAAAAAAARARARPRSRALIPDSRLAGSTA